jgi:hypothetical protein
MLDGDIHTLHMDLKGHMIRQVRLDIHATSNLINFEPLRSRAPKADSKAFLYVGHIWSTSKADIMHGVWPKSLTIE